MPAPKSFTKQPSDTENYAFDFSDWIGSKAGRQPASYVVTASDGLTTSDARNGNIVTVYASGGTHGVRYKVSVTLTTDGSPALTHQLDAYIMVKED